MFTSEILENTSAATGNIIPATSSPYINALIILAASVILAKIADFIFEKIFLKITSRTETEIDDKIVAGLKSPIYYIVMLVGVYAASHSLEFGTSAFYYIDNLIQTALIVVGAIAIWRITDIIIGDVVAKFAAKTKSALDDEMMPLLKNISRIVIIFAAILAALSAWDINITPLLASAGIVGIALAFAAQSTVAHLFGGISVYFDKPFKVGDRIQLESGETGDVIEIGIRSTRVKTLENSLVIVPNDKIANSKIINFHQPVSAINLRLVIGVAYGSNVRLVKKALLLAAKNSGSVLKEPAPEVLFTEHGDFALKFLLVAWISDPAKKLAATDEINTEIDKEFRKAKIEIAFPTQTVYLKKQC